MAELLNLETLNFHGNVSIAIDVPTHKARRGEYYPGITPKDHSIEKNRIFVNILHFISLFLIPLCPHLWKYTLELAICHQSKDKYIFVE